jgi:long-chain acyl-CoA synthetase
MSATSGNIAERLTAPGRSDSPAVICGDVTLTHGDLRAAMNGIAALLADHGTRVGDRVGLFAENGPLFVSAYLGAIRAGACVVPFQTECDETTFQRIVRSTEMARIVVSKRQLAKVGAWAERAGLEIIGEDHTAAAHGAAPAAFPAVDPDRDLAALMYTSGSTGEPKGVQVTHRNIETNTRDIVAYLRLSAADRVMAVLPFYYCYGASLLHSHLAAGGCAALARSFMFPEKVLDEMAKLACTGFAGVPSTYQILLRKTRFKERKFPALRWLQQAGGMLPKPFLRELRESFPEVALYVMYGQTEATSRMSYLPPEHLDEKLGSIGKGLPSTRLEVLRPDGTPVAPGSDEIGEIVASGANVTAGYWRDPEETARFFRAGRLHTGDLARVDADGFIYVVERARDFVKSMGNRVSPKEIEDVIAELPDVVEVAVFGVPDDLFGEAIKAVVVSRAGEAEALEAVRAHCLKRLPNFKIPRHVEARASLPKTATGKVDKVRLRNE